MKKMLLICSWGLLILGLFGCKVSTSNVAAPVSQLEGGHFPGDLKINQLQVLGTHNSYARPVDTALLNWVDPLLAKAMGPNFLASLPPAARAQYEENHPHLLKMSEMLAYDHPDFPTQLAAGLRSLEIDVYCDPTGRRFREPAGYALLKKMGKASLAPYDTAGLSQPGFKVLHIADLDFRTHYPTFQGALAALRRWSDAHPQHLPIFLLIEAKDRGLPIFPQAAPIVAFDEVAYAELDATIWEVLGRDKVITPDQVRGNFPTLEAAVLAQNWPLLRASRGKFVFLLLPSTGGFSLDTPYLKDRPNLEGRAMFVQSQPGQSHAAFLLLDNAIMRQEEIKDAVQKGYLVRSRADIDTYEAKINDPKRAAAAFSSGAQVISTDFFRPGNAYGTAYFVQLPGGGAGRINPVNGPRPR